MTKKFRKQLKKRILAFALFASATLLSLCVIQKASLFSAPENSLKIIENDTQETNYTNIEIVQGNVSNSIAKVASNVIECESLVQGIRDTNLPDGDYTFKVNGKTSDGASETKTYLVELINFYDDVTYSLSLGQTTRTISLGDTTTTHKTLAVKYHKNLTINSGVTVTATAVSNLTYKKGMLLCVMGNITNNGTISMTARGTYNQAGENVYLWKSADETFEYVPAVRWSISAE